MANKKLGRGLDAIFGGDVSRMIDDLEKNEAQVEIALDEIRPNPYQPRQYFDESKIEELSESIKLHGVFTPIIVNQSIQGYDLIAGERRVRAAKLAGLVTIPAIIVSFDEQQMMEIALLENVQRENLNTIEEARGYRLIIDQLSLTQEELSKRIGKSRAHIANTMRLLQLPDMIQESVLKGHLTMGHVKPLITLDSQKAQEIAKRAIEESLSVRDVENIVKGLELNSHKKPKETKERDVHVVAAERQLSRRFGSKVKIENQSIQIKYTDVADLNRLLELLGLTE